MGILKIKDYRILKYSYKLNNDELGDVMWDNMDDDERLWLVNLTFEGVYISSGDNTNPAWDIFFIKPKI